MATIPELATWIEARDDIAVVAHVSPDGDTLGSGLALVRVLTALASARHWSARIRCPTCTVPAGE
jgi:nanoRNase/pAp phosphatase (c-di-AMP/oligoRNAs hydrolase)